MDLSGKDIDPKDTTIELQNVGFSYGDHRLLFYISGLVMLEDEKVVGYGYVTGYYASEVGGMCMFMEEMYFTPECRGKGYGTKPIIGL